jgi:hypothetical protein
MTDATNKPEEVDQLQQLDDEGWIVQREAEVVAIFPNNDGDIVISQTVHCFPRDHVVTIILARNNVPDAIAAMRRAAGSATLGKDRTASERQKRYRERHRNRRYVTSDVTQECGAPLLRAAE